MKERLRNAWFNICDAAYDHPHIATVLTLIGIFGFVALNLVTDFWPAMIALILATLALFYLGIYSLIKDLL